MVALLLSSLITSAARSPALAEGPRRVSIPLLAGVLQIDTTPDLALGSAQLEAALAKVESEVRELDKLLALEESPAGPAVPAAPAAADARLVQSIERALGVCAWSSGAHGPFAGELNSLWGLRHPSGGIPGDQALATALSGNRCDLRVDARKADLGLGALRSRLDLHGFRKGALVDRAATVLSEHGIRHARLDLEGIFRASGDAPTLTKGSGWPIQLPTMPGSSRAETVFLRNGALAIIDSFSDPLLVGGESFPRYFDQRTGRPAQGTLAVLVATETASDAESLAVALFSLGSREGQFRLGNLRPQPAARWVQGSGGGEPLVVDSRWSAVFGAAGAASGARRD